MAFPHLGFSSIVEQAVSFAAGIALIITAYATAPQAKQVPGHQTHTTAKKTQAVRTRVPKKIPSPYLPPMVKETPPAGANGFVFIKRGDSVTHE